MVRMKKERIISFILAVTMILTSLMTNTSVAFAEEAEVPQHAIQIADTEHGSLAVKNGVDTAAAGEVISLLYDTEEGYQLKEVVINDGSVEVEPLAEAQNELQFVMPDKDVFVEAAFVPIETETVEKENGSQPAEEKLQEETEPVSEGNDADMEELLETPEEPEAVEPPTEQEQDEEPVDPTAEPEETEESSEKISGVYYGFQTMDEILEMAANGLDLQDFFQYSIWGFLNVDDIRYLAENGLTLEDLYRVIEGETSYYNSVEIQSMVERYWMSQNTNAGISTFSTRSITGSTATAAISGSVSNAALGSISAFGPGDHGNMLRITLDGESAFCAQYGASCRTGMTYTKVSGDELGIDRSQQYLIYRVIGWYYEAQQINDNTGNYAITQAAIWLIRNGQWGSAESMAAAIRPMLTKVTVLDDATSIALFQAMADWVNGDVAQPRVGIDFWYNGPNQYLVTVGGNTHIETEDPEYSAYVKLQKTDSVTGEAIDGEAEFKIYTEDGTDTGATFSKSGNTYTSTTIIKDDDHDTFYVQEVTAPNGYLLDEEKYYFTIEDGDEDAEKVITTNGSSFANEPYWVQISIPKVDAETGKKIENGAEFTVTAKTGSLSDPVTFTKQADGSYLSSRIYYNESNQGEFFVQETKAPAGYYGDWEDESAGKTAGSNENKVKYSFTVDEDTHGQTLKITNEGEAFINSRVKGTITISKIDVEAGAYISGDAAHGDSSLDGAVYGLYAKEDIKYPDGTSGVKYPAGTLVAEGTIQNGQCTWDELYLGAYYVKEIIPATGYLLDEKEYDVTLTYADESVEIVTGQATVDEQVKKRAFQLLKLDGESQNEQFELSGAGFEVYLLSDLGIDAAGQSDEALIQAVMEKYPDYKNGLGDDVRAKLYENDSNAVAEYNAAQAAAGGSGLTQIGTNYYQLNEIFTDSTGRLISPELPYGTYVVVETTVPKNTLIDIKPFIVRIEEDSREPLYQRYFLDKDFTAKIKITKIDADTGKTVLKAGTSYRIYDLDNEKYVQLPVVVDNKEVLKEVFVTDTDGYILTDAPLPCGRYRIEEVQAPDGFYNEAVGTGSTLGNVEFEINTDQAYETSDISGDAIIEFKYSNRETRGELTIEKIGEQLTGAGNVPGAHSVLEKLADVFGIGDEDVEFVYEKLPIAGAEYTIEAAEDIYTQDNQVDENGNRTVWFRQGETVAVLVTGEDGQIDSVKYPTGGFAEHPIVEVIHSGETGKVTVRLPLGSYKVYESKAPYGYLHTDEVKDITFTWENQEEEIVFNSTPATDESGMTVFENERVKPIPEDGYTEIGVGIYKHDQDTQEPVPNTVFGLYTADDIYNVNGELIVAADTLLGTAVTNEDGFASFDIDIPYMSEGYDGTEGNSGDYYIVEHEVPEGFFLDQTPLPVHFEYKDEHTPYIVVQAKQTNISTSVDISKVDLQTGEPLAGATLQIIEKATGEVVYEFETVEEVQNIRHLKLSTEDSENIYILREIRPAAGYVSAEDIEFKLIQAMDEEGNLLTKADVYVLQDMNQTVKKSGLIKGAVTGEDQAVTFVTWELEDETLTLWVNTELDAELLSQVVKESDFADLEFTEVRFAEGTLEGFYEDLVVKASVLSSILPWARTENETETEPAWVKVSDAIVLMEDDVTKVYITKYDIADGSPVIGAEMEITDLDGNVIEKWTTTEEEHYIEKLPVGEYILKETLAPTEDGYVRAEDIVFTVEDDGSIQKVKMADDFTKLDISKVDIAGEEIPGAHLVLKDKDGNIVDEWDSTTEPHRIERIEPGEYTLIETVVPDGYAQAEEVTFVVEETGEVQKVEMVDEPAKGHIEIYKTGDVLKGYTTHSSDFGTIYRMEFEKDNLAGVEFTVYDESGAVADVITTDEAGYGISKELNVGNYVVKETKTPSGLAANYNEYKVQIAYKENEGTSDAVLEVENRVLDTEINVYKVGEMVQAENGTFGYGSKPLEGVYFGIYTGEDIKNADGQTVLSEDQLIGVIKTNKEGKATLKSALVSGKYYYKELQTLPGFVLDNEKHTFELSLGNEPTTIFEVNKESPLLNVAKKNAVQLIKVDAADTTKRLPGVEFELYRADDEKIGTYVTDANGEINITNLAYGEYYFKESKSAQGYQRILGKINFEIGDEKVVITCKNTTIPKLGFEDSYLGFAIGGVLLASAGFITFMIIRKKRGQNE